MRKLTFLSGTVMTTISNFEVIQYERFKSMAEWLGQPVIPSLKLAHPRAGIVLLGSAKKAW